MRYVIDPDKRPAYLQLYAQLRGDIVAGVYPFAARLPSKRLLAEECGVSTITVEHAYSLLCDEGYAEARERSGYFVLFRPTDGFAASAARPRPAAPPPAAAHSYPDFSLPQLSRTMRRVLSEYGEALLAPSPHAGLFALRRVLTQYLARNRGIRAAPEQIVIGSGAEYLYGQIMALLGRERVYATESPPYKKIEQIFAAAGVPYRLLPLSSDGIDSAALAATDAEILHTTPYRSFPSGVTASASKRHEYVLWSEAGPGYLLEFDYGSEFSVSGQPAATLFSLARRENVIYLNTFSKTISPSLRVGYMVLPAPLAAQYEARLGFYACPVPTFEQYVLTELIESGDFERHINRVRRALRRTLAKEPE